MTKAPACRHIHFVSLRLADRRDDLLIRAIDDLRRAMRATMTRHPMRIDAIAVLPAVVHMICTLPEDDAGLRGRIALLKSTFSKAVSPPVRPGPRFLPRPDKRLWHPRLRHHRIADGSDLAHHRTLIHLSPVHADLCGHPRDWPHSSFHHDRHPAPPPARHEHPRAFCVAPSGPSALSLA